MKCSFASLLLAAAGVLTVNAQTSPGLEWERAFGGTNADFAHVVKSTSDGGSIVAGYSFSDISGNKTSASQGGGDCWMVKLDAGGNKQWERSFGGTELDRVNDVQQTSDGGYIVGSTSHSGISGNKTSASLGGADYWVLKLDANGNKQWERSFGGSQVDDLRAVQQTSDGGFVLGGFSASSVSGNKTSAAFGSAGDYWIVKLDANGNKQWDKTYGGTDADELHAVQQTIDGGFIVGGHSFSITSGNKISATLGSGTSDSWVLKLDASGNKQWERCYGGADSEQLHSIQQTSDGGYALGGTSYSSVSAGKSSGSHGSHDYWVVKIDAAGAVQWDQSFGGIDADELHSVQQTGDGGYLLGGVSFSGISGNKTSTSSGSHAGDYWMVKLDASGNKQWEQAARGSFAGEILRLQLTGDDGYIVAGLSSSAAQAEPDYAIAKLRGPLRLDAYSMVAPGVFQTRAAAITGHDYVLEASTNLTQWAAVQTQRAVNGSVSFSHASVPGTPKYFYRVKQL
ncbi:MAG TPA: hypothetical protein VK530_19060 [Candidatus Acidoferrum sp.]|nr:hypothetical protein [Candidatus Acidoferrum sp.]